MQYDIYAGLSGSFGGPNLQGTWDFHNLEEATQFAYDLAVEEYESYASCHGLLTWDECKEDLCNSFPDEKIDDSDVDTYYLEEVEDWISYSALIHEE